MNKIYIEEESVVLKFIGYMAYVVTLLAITYICMGV